MAAEQFFLPPAAMDDTTRFRAPPRDGTVKVLIDGTPTFRAMEQDIARAEKSVYISFWVFDPEVPLQATSEVASILKSRKILPDPRVKDSAPLVPGERPPTKWGELLGVIARSGVDVRVLLSDFDPIAQWRLHREAWTAHGLLLAEGQRLTMRPGGGLTVMSSLHQAFLRVLDATFVNIKATDKLPSLLTNLLAELNLQDLARMPGLWPFVQVEGRRIVRRGEIDWRIFIASHHQKTCMIDDKIAYCGGLDVQPGRVDTRAHWNLWHDLMCRVEGEAAGDVVRNFVGRWNAERVAFNEFVTRARQFKPPKVPWLTPEVNAIDQRPPRPPVSGPAKVQLLRTLSQPRSDRRLPDVVRKDVEESYQQAIANATKYIYIENQYFRNTVLAQQIVDRVTRVSGLIIIVVVPIAPEELRPSETPDEITLHGVAVQHKSLRWLADNIPDATNRLGIFSMVHPSAAQEKLRAKAILDRQGQSAQVYVHSKGLIVDDEFASVGSANTTLRSFRLDTEACIGFHDPDGVTAFRLDLWSELLGSPSDLAQWTPAEFVSKWKAIARANSVVPPRRRKGFIVEHDIDRFRGKAIPLVPEMDTLAEVYVPDPDRSTAVPV